MDDQKISNFERDAKPAWQIKFCSKYSAGGQDLHIKINKYTKIIPTNRQEKIDRETKKDIEWWLNFMESFDGITIMPPTSWEAPDTLFSSDVNLTACGGEAGNQVFHKVFPKWLTTREDIHINELELITVVISLKIWASRIRNKNFLAYCDNEVSCEVVNTGRAKNRFAQACLREICYISKQQCSTKTSPYFQ